MKILEKVQNFLGIGKNKAKGAIARDIVAKPEKRMPTGGSKWTVSTDTSQRKKKRKLNKLANKARNIQHRLAA
jgi:hypothetical protein